MKGVLGLLSTKRPTMFAYLVTSCVRNHTISFTHMPRDDNGFWKFWGVRMFACVCVCVCLCVSVCVSICGVG